MKQTAYSFRLLLAGLLALACALPIAGSAAPAPAPALAEETFQKDQRPPPDITKDRTLYLVGYAHLDTQWNWSYQQTINEYLRNTLNDNFRLLDKYPNYVFNFSGSHRYKLIKEYYPQEYEKLKGYIARGRWFPCGSSVDECDCNMPSGESIIRQILYGNRFFKQEFGVTSQEFMLPDCFGFPASLPSLLAHCGLKGFSTQKLTWGSANGIPFKIGTWTGPDSKGVVAALDPGSYTGAIKEDLSHSESWLQRIENTGTASGAFVDYHYYGVGDRGGAPAESSIRWMEKSLIGNGPIRVVSSKANALFNALTPEQIQKLPKYQGDLLLTEHSAGSLTSEAYMKRWNRKNELLADVAERASVIAAWLGGRPYPASRLSDAWHLFLGCQMHDMLPGTSIQKAYEYCWNDELLASNQFADVTSDAAAAIASAMETTTGGIPLVIYNPLSVERADLVEATIRFPGEAPRAIKVAGPNGKPIPVQINRRNGNELTILFEARMPSVGFVIYEVNAAPERALPSILSVSARTLENPRYKVTLNDTGNIASIYDKLNSRELLAAPVRMEFHDENPSKYPAWNMDWTDRQKPARGFVDGPASIRIVEQGPVRAAIEVSRSAEGSRFVQQFRLAATGDIIEVVNKIDWRTQKSSLKAAFPFTVSNSNAFYEDKLGIVLRGNNEPKRYEVPQQQWFDLTNKARDYGVAVLNDCKFGSDKPDDNTMRLTLLYTPGTRGGHPDQATQDFGLHEFAYALAGHAGAPGDGGVPWLARRFNQPPLAFQTAAHSGPLGR